MARYIRVRSTRPQGCHRAGMFHGVKPVVYDTNDLTPDQIRLLRDENGRMLLVDNVDGPEAAHVVPDGDKVGQVDQFTSHPGARVDMPVDEYNELLAKNENLVGDVARAREQFAAETLAREAAIKAKAAAEAQRSEAANARDAAQGQLEAARQGKADAEAALDAVQDELAAIKAAAEQAQAQSNAAPKSRGRKPKPETVDTNTDPAATPLD